MVVLRMWLAEMDAKYALEYGVYAPRLRDARESKRNDAPSWEAAPVLGRTSFRRPCSLCPRTRFAMAGSVVLGILEYMPPSSQWWTQADTDRVVDWRAQRLWRRGAGERVDEARRGIGDGARSRAGRPRCDARHQKDVLVAFVALDPRGEPSR